MKLIRFIYLLVTAFSVVCLVSCNEVVEKFVSSDDEEAGSAEVADSAAGQEGGGSGGSKDELIQRRKDLKDRVGALKKALDEGDDLVKKELEVVERLGTLRQYSGQVEKVHAEGLAALDSWRNATRGSFVGVQLPKIETVGGAVYSDVTIKNVADGAIVIEHSGGTDTVEITDLTVQLRRNLIHEPTVLAEREG